MDEDVVYINVCVCIALTLLCPKATDGNVSDPYTLYISVNPTTHKYMGHPPPRR